MLTPPLPRNVEASFRDVGSTKPEIRAAAIGDIVRHVRVDATLRERALGPLEKALADGHAAVRAAACVALADLEAKEALPKLLVCVEDSDAYVRQMALSALGEIGDPRARARLSRALSDERAEVRYQATIAFARVAKAKSDDADVIAALGRAMKDDDDAVSHIAMRVLEERIDEGLVISEELREIARERLDAESAHVALAAAIVLVKSGDDAGRDLVRAVVRGDRVRGQTPEKEDERAAVELAGEAKMTELTADLEKRAFGLARHVKDTCAFHARISLARMGHARAIAEILGDLASNRAETRARAISSAGRARIERSKDALRDLLSNGDVQDQELAKEALDSLSKSESKSESKSKSKSESESESKSKSESESESKSKSESESESESESKSKSAPR